eukprot:COSAG01_NODE_23766_length_802_cov_1.422475_1_plen_197_part_01
MPVAVRPTGPTDCWRFAWLVALVAADGTRVRCVPVVPRSATGRVWRRQGGAAYRWGAAGCVGVAKIAIAGVAVPTRRHLASAMAAAYTWVTIAWVVLTCGAAVLAVAGTSVACATDLASAMAAAYTWVTIAWVVLTCGAAVLAVAGTSVACAADTARAMPAAVVVIDTWIFCASPALILPKASASSSRAAPMTTINT